MLLLGAQCWHCIHRVFMFIPDIQVLARDLSLTRSQSSQCMVWPFLLTEVSACPPFNCEVSNWHPDSSASICQLRYHSYPLSASSSLTVLGTALCHLRVLTLDGICAPPPNMFHSFFCCNHWQYILHDCFASQAIWYLEVSNVSIHRTTRKWFMFAESCAIQDRVLLDALCHHRM